MSVQHKPAALDLTGQRYGRLVAIKRIARPSHMKNKSAWWLFKCDCGADFKTNANNVRSGKIKSCGCWQKERLLTHGKTGTKLFSVWCGMRDRCANANSGDFPRYGGRGITVCDEWENSFQAFYDWAMSHGYSDGLTIDRIDTNGDYCPENCRWATRKEQANNRRTNIYLTYEGDTFTLAQWAERVGIAWDTLSKRLYRHGWSIEKALTTPVRKQRNNVRCSERSA